MSDSIRFVYLRDNKNQPVACIAVAYDSESKQAAYGISVRNPQDRFDRNVARDLAVGRLIRKTTKVNLNSPGQKIDCHYITRRIMEDLLMWSNSELPSRAKKAAVQWLKSSNLKQELLDSLNHKMEISYDVNRI